MTEDMGKMGDIIACDKVSGS